MDNAEKREVCDEKWFDETISSYEKEDRTSVYSGFPTDTIISSYEKKLSGSITDKILFSNKNHKPVHFTKEETDYLTRKAEDESPFAEVKVISPSPDITLKKGDTQINIKNAATLVRKMEEIRPTPITKNVEEPLGETIEKFNKKWNVKLVNPPYSSDQTESTLPGGFMNTVNKNAYEIRSDVLSQALDWVKWQTDCSIEIARRTDKSAYLTTDQIPNSDRVLEIAKKFYSFVENRR